MNEHDPQQALDASDQEASGMDAAPWEGAELMEQSPERKDKRQAARDVLLAHKTTDTDAAELFRDFCGSGLFRYDKQRKIWMKWSKHFWQEDIKDTVDLRAKESARRIGALAKIAFIPTGAKDDPGPTLGQLRIWQ